ncbi:MAG: glycosyltransferase family 2 protein [Chloroflexi bacterium]|nr:glycosyltransferase family 2 protein [Chloroflexota bacterium]
MSTATNPRVSVVIPVYNGERFLAAAIESVVAQAPAVAEVIVVDDGSEDGSAAVAENWGAPVRCIRIPHAGIGAARNAGIEAASGDFVAFLDADDLWTERRLAAQLAAFATEPALDMVFGLAEQFRDDRLPVTGMQGQGPAYIAGAMLIRAASLRRVGLFATGIRMGEFIDWYARAKDLGLKEALLPALVVRRRIHDENTGLREAANRLDYTRVLRAALERRRAAGQE